MATAGLSLTTEVFEKNLIKARAVLFILLTLSISSLTTLILNILVGRYTPEFLDSMNLYGFSALRFRVSETSFPSFDVQSAWAVAMATGSCLPRFKRLFCFIAGIITLSVVLTAQCFISDAVMGTYIGIIMYYAASWIVSENRENIPLISA
jgi:membrane-associated phospholipid phosphatase